jgi:hypothetical protein
VVVEAVIGGFLKEVKGVENAVQYVRTY